MGGALRRGRTGCGWVGSSLVVGGSRPQEALQSSQGLLTRQPGQGPATCPLPRRAPKRQLPQRPPSCLTPKRLRSVQDGQRALFNTTA